MDYPELETKIKLEASVRPLKSCYYKGVKIFVKPFLTSNDKIELTKNYCSTLFDDKERVFQENFFIAEKVLCLNIIDICTNIDIKNDEISLALDIDDFTSDVFWSELLNLISNYQEFKHELSEVVNYLMTKNTYNIMLSNNLVNLMNQAIMTDMNLDMPIRELKNTVDDLKNEMISLDTQVPGFINNNKKKVSNGKSKNK